MSTGELKAPARSGLFCQWNPERDARHGPFARLSHV